MNLLEDSRRLVLEFRTPLERDSAQIYRTAIPFSPRFTNIHTRFISQCKDDITVESGSSGHWTPCIAVLERHQSPVHTIAFSPDGSKIASGSDTIRIWASETGKLLKELPDHDDPIMLLSFSPDGTHVASASSDRVHIWDIETGSMNEGVLAASVGDALAMTFSSNGRKVFLGSYGQTDDDFFGYYISSVDISTDKKEAIADTGSDVILSAGPQRANQPLMAISPARHEAVVSTDDQKLCVYDTTSGSLITTTDSSHSSLITTLAYSHNHIVSASRDKTVCIWDPVTGTQLARSSTLGGLRHNFPLAVASSSNGDHFAAGTHGRELHIFEQSTGSAIGEPLEGHTEAIIAVAFSPDGSIIASGSFDKSLRLWESRLQTEESTVSNKRLISAVAFSPDGSQFITASKHLRLRNTSDGEEIGTRMQGHAGQILKVVFSPSGMQVVSVALDNEARIWDIDSRTSTVTHLPCVYPQGIIVEFSPDSSQLITSSFSPALFVRNIQTGITFTFTWKSRIFSTAFSADGKLVASGCEDGTVIIWDSKTGAPTTAFGQPLRGHVGPVLSVFSP